MPRKGPEISDQDLFDICYRLAHKQTATEIRDALEERKVYITREQVYPLLRRGFTRGFIRLSAPLENTLKLELEDRYSDVEFHIVNARHDTTPDAVAETGADLVIKLIKKVAEIQRETGSEKQNKVNIGLAPGRALQKLSRHLGMLMRAEPKLPDIVIQALSSGISAGSPINAPVAFFSFFDNVAAEIEFVGLFAPAVVKWNEYEDLIQLPGIHESFDRKNDIDIVVVSMADATDDCGAFNKFMKMRHERKFLGRRSPKKILEKKGWIGDVHWRPFSAKGPITADTVVRSVTLFELEELVEWAKQKKKKVVLLAGPCGKCKRSKSGALKHLLRNPSLRVFNHLVTDVNTARDLL